MVDEINTNLDTTPLPPNNLVAQDPQSAELAGYVRTKTFGREVREAIARSIELNSTRSKNAENIASETVNVANDLTDRFNQQIGALTEDAEVIDARNGANTLRDRLESDRLELTKELVDAKPSLMIDNSFDDVPYVLDRSNGVYQFSTAQTSDGNTLKIVSSGYGTSISTTKDFAMILTENIIAGDTITIRFKGKPSLSGQSMTARIAYGSPTTIALGEADIFTEIETTLNISTDQRQAGYIYFDLLSDYELTIKDFEIVSESGNEILSAKSFAQINTRLSSIATSISNSTTTVNRMLEIAWTYQERINQFVYGNQTTAFDTESTLTNGKHEMDCSSFVNLMIQGIPYHHSRYSSLSDNIKSPLFYTGIDGHKFRYANSIARYAVENGLAFLPNSDYSNVRPGDVLFFSWQDPSSVGDTPAEARKSAFMQIDHVAIYIDKNNDNCFNTIQYYPNSKSVTYLATASYMEQCVLVARFPFADLTQREPLKNLIVNGDKAMSSTTSIDTGTWVLSDELKSGKFYTVVFDGEILSHPDDNFMVYNGTIQLYSDNQRVRDGKHPKGVHKFTFYTNQSSTLRKLTIKIGTSGRPSVNAKVNWIRLYEGVVLDDVYRHELGRVRSYEMTLSTKLKDVLNPTGANELKYRIDGNILQVQFNLNLTTSQSGVKYIGNYAENIISVEKRVPLYMFGDAGTTTGHLRLLPNGEVHVVPNQDGFSWKIAMATATVFLD